MLFTARVRERLPDQGLCRTKVKVTVKVSLINPNINQFKKYALGEGHIYSDPDENSTSNYSEQAPTIIKCLKNLGNPVAYL